MVILCVLRNDALLRYMYTETAEHTVLFLLVNFSGPGVYMTCLGNMEKQSSSIW